MSPAPAGRRVSDPFLLKLKALTQLLKEACGGQEAAAMVTRVSHQSISRYGLVHEDGIREDTTFIPVDVLCDLMKFGRHYKVLEAIADEMGFVLVPKAETAKVGEVVRLVGQYSRGAGELTDEALAAAADGRLEPAEKAQVVETIKEQMQCLAELGRTVERAG